MSETCLCGASLLTVQVPEKTVVCTRTLQRPCANFPLPAHDAGLTVVEWSRRRSEAWHRLLNAQEAMTSAAAHYADVCFRSGIARADGSDG